MREKIKWRRLLRWVPAALAGVLVIIGVGGYLLLRGSAFNQFARHKIADAVQQATGAPTTIRGLDFSLSKLTFDLHNITVHGTEAPDQAPLMQIDRLRVGLKIQSVLNRKISLSELIIEHPVAHVHVDHAGNSNLPTAPPSEQTSHTSVFDLAVRHAQLMRGEVTYNDREAPLDVDLYNLGAEIRFEPLATRYAGSVSYDNGHLHYGEYASLAHSFQASFSVTPAVFTIDSATLKVGNSAASMHGNLSDYADPVVSGDYNLHIDAHDFASLAPAYKPSGDLSLIGQIRYRNIPSQPMLRSLAVDGRIASEALSAVAAKGRISVGKLRGNYQLANGNLQATSIEFDSLGGRLNADLNIQNLDGTPSGALRASLRSISLQAMQRASGQEVRKVAISGTLNGTAIASWTGSVSKIRLQSDLAVTAAATRSSRLTAVAPTNEIPVTGAIHATYDGARKTLTLRQSTLQIPSATLTADGELSNRSNLRLQATASDLHQLESVVSAIEASSSTLPPVSGSANLNANVRGSLTKPEIEADFSAQNLNVQGSGWKSAQASLHASPSQIVITKGALVSAQRGRASFNGAVALHDWQYLPNNSLKGNLSVQQMSISELQRIADLQYPVSGDVTANLSVTGTQLDPQGSGKIEIASANAYGEPIQTLTAQFHADHGAIVSSFRAVLPAGSADADLSYTPKTKAYNVRVDLPSLVLQKLHTIQAKNLALSGTLTASASGQGTLDNPQLNALLQLPQLTVRDKSISTIKAEIHTANHKADLVLSSKVVDASVQARASLDLTGDYYADASIETTAIPLDVLLATYLPSVPEGFRGQTEIHATMKGPLKDKTRLEAHLTVPTLNATYQSLQIGIASPVHADYSHSVLTVQPAEIRGTDTSLRVEGSIPFAGNTAPSMTAQGTLDVRIVKIFSPDTKSSGTISFDVRASGSAQNPSINGQVHLQDVAMLYAGAPLGVEKLNGTLDIGKESIQVSKLSGQMGGGDFSAGGSIAYRPSLRFNLALQSRSVRLRYPDGLRTLLDSNLAFNGNLQSSTLSGRVLIDSLSFTSDFDLSSFADQFSGDTSIPAQPGFADDIKLAIGVQSKENLSANSSQISIEGSVNVQVGGTAADPVITGRTDLTAGEVFYRNVRYELQRGIISFDDPNQTHPVLNVSATTTVEQYNLTLNLRGPFDKLTTSYTSDPPLSTADIINLVARGQTTEESTASSQSTDSMIASQAASQLTGGLQRLVGISSLQINPPLGGNNQNPGATIAVQQRVTKNFLFTFSTDVSQAGSEVVEGEYQINKRWSVSATRDQVGGVAVDGRLHTRF